MAVAVNQLTPFPAANQLLKELLASVQAILGIHFIGLYLDGSLASGDFDQASDIDFVVVSASEITGSLYTALQAMHDRLATSDSPWAVNLEGTYISQRALRRYDPAEGPHPNLERGRGERLKMVLPGAAWNIHRWVLRERGIVLAGPAPHTLIDPVAPDDLRQGALKELHGWIADRLSGLGDTQRGGQSYLVLTLCRILVTLENGSIASKPAAARWAEATLGERWVPLIESALEGRHHPGLAVSPEDEQGTLDFIRFARERSRPFPTAGAT